MGNDQIVTAPVETRRVPILLRPGWIVFTLVVLVLLIVFASLGMWQLRRLDERRLDNTILASRLQQVVPLDQLLSQPGVLDDPDFFQYTMVSATGTFGEQGAVDVRSQVEEGVAGVHGVYPFDLGNGTAVLVNVGWFPMGFEREPVSQIFGGSPQVELVGMVQPTQLRTGFGRVEPAGLLERVSRIDVERISQQVELPLLPFWVQLVSPDDPDRLPVPVPLPTLDEGPHFSYAVQWFSFGVVLLGGYLAMLRREFKRSRRAAERSD